MSHAPFNQIDIPMHSQVQLPFVCRRSFLNSALPALLAIALAGPMWAQPIAKTAADEWMEVRFMATPLPIPPPASGKHKTEKEAKEDQQRQSAAFATASARAKEFYTKHPNDANANEARKIEAVTLMQAVQLGLTAEEPRAQRLAAEFRSDLKQSSAHRYEVASLMTQSEVWKKKIKDRDALMAEHERHAFVLLGEFPGEPAIYERFLGIAHNSNSAKAREMAEHVLMMPAPTHLKEQALAVLDRLNLPGTSPGLEWQDENGVSRKISDYKGKIVIFYVWATWIPEAENAHALVASAVSAGIELVCVNVDTDVTQGQQARKKTTLPGGNYYDERGLKSPLALQLKANQVPGVHVIDAKGVYVGRGLPSDLPKLLQQAGK